MDKIQKTKILGLKVVSAIMALMIASYSSDSNPILEQKLTILIASMVNFLMAVFFLKHNDDKEDNNNA